MENEDEVIVRFDWDRTRERILDASIQALERLVDKMQDLSARAERLLRSGKDDGEIKAEDERLVRETGRLLRSTISEWRDACIEKNKARGITREYAFDIRAAEAEVERRLAALARSTSRQETDRGS